MARKNKKFIALANKMISCGLAKKPISVRLDNEVLSWFRATGKGWQTRMNNVLQAYMHSNSIDNQSHK